MSDSRRQLVGRRSKAAGETFERWITDAWLDIEEKCEGKTIFTLSANDFGMIIRFTDGSCLRYINGALQFEER